MEASGGDMGGDGGIDMKNGRRRLTHVGGPDAIICGGGGGSLSTDVSILLFNNRRFAFDIPSYEGLKCRIEIIPRRYTNRRREGISGRLLCTHREEQITYGLGKKRLCSKCEP